MIVADIAPEILGLGQRTAELCAEPRPYDCSTAAGETGEAEEWAEFGHQAGRKYFNWEEVKHEIIRQTELVGELLSTRYNRLALFVTCATGASYL